MSADLKKKKARSVRDSLRTVGSFASAQGMVWDEISAKFDRMAAEPSPTMALSDLYEAHRETSQDYLKAFHPVVHQIGIVVFIDGTVAGVELLGKFEAFKKNHAKLVHSYVMDAIEALDAKMKRREKPSRSKAARILQSAGKGSVEKRNSVSLGQDVRLESEEVIGAGLEFESQVLQMTLFMKEENRET